MRLISDSVSRSIDECIYRAGVGVTKQPAITPTIDATVGARVSVEVAVTASLMILILMILHKKI